MCPNQLLKRLTDEQLQSLLPWMELVQNNLKDVMYERNHPISYVYFPCNCAHSTIVFLEDGFAVEVGTAGNEGFSGVAVLVGATIATETAVCQIAGKSMRIQVDHFREAIKGITPLRHIAERYCQAYLGQVAQSVACNRRHTIEERFARWLLITHDRVHGDDFLLTQEFLSVMLGVQRSSVSLIAGKFQQAGIIEYKRGHMHILDRSQLERTSCECYATIRSNFKRLLGVPYG